MDTTCVGPCTQPGPTQRVLGKTLREAPDGAISVMLAPRLQPRDLRHEASSLRQATLPRRVCSALSADSPPAAPRALPH